MADRRGSCSSGVRGSEQGPRISWWWSYGSTARNVSLDDAAGPGVAGGGLIPARIPKRTAEAPLWGTLTGFVRAGLARAVEQDTTLYYWVPGTQQRELGFWIEAMAMC